MYLIFFDGHTQRRYYISTTKNYDNLILANFQVIF